MTTDRPVRRAALFPVLLLCGALAPFALLGGAPALAAIEDYLPVGDETVPWRMVEPPVTVGPDELARILGDAGEIHREFGIVAGTRATYADSDNVTVEIDIFEMPAAVAAYGLYRHLATGLELVQVGQEGARSRRYIVFWKGRHVVTLTAFTTSDATDTGMPILGAAVDGKLPAEGDRPEVVRRLAESGHKDLFYATGWIGFSSHSPFGSIYNVPFQEAAAGRRGAARTLLLRCADADECHVNDLKGRRALPHLVTRQWGTYLALVSTAAGPAAVKDAKAALDALTRIFDPAAAKRGTKAPGTKAPGAIRPGAKPPGSRTPGAGGSRPAR